MCRIHWVSPRESHFGLSEEKGLQERERQVLLSMRHTLAGAQEGARRVFVSESLGQSLEKVHSSAGPTASGVWSKSVTAPDLRSGGQLRGCVCGSVCVQAPAPQRVRLQLLVRRARCAQVCAAPGLSDWWHLLPGSSMWGHRKSWKPLPSSSPKSKLIWKMLAQILHRFLKIT